jgi:hypothetical protein
LLFFLTYYMMWLDTNRGEGIYEYKSYYYGC